MSITEVKEVNEKLIKKFERFAYPLPNASVQHLLIYWNMDEHKPIFPQKTNQEYDSFYNRLLCEYESLLANSLSKPTKMEIMDCIEEWLRLFRHGCSVPKVWMRTCPIENKKDHSTKVYELSIASLGFRLVLSCLQTSGVLF
jgi:hypothetical protein